MCKRWLFAQLYAVYGLQAHHAQKDGPIKQHFTTPMSVCNRSLMGERKEFVHGIWIMNG